MVLIVFGKWKIWLHSSFVFLLFSFFLASSSPLKYFLIVFICVLYVHKNPTNNKANYYGITPDLLRQTVLINHSEIAYACWMCVWLPPTAEWTWWRGGKCKSTYICHSSGRFYLNPCVIILVRKTDNQLCEHELFQN